MTSSGRSEELFQRAREVMPGGVSSPVRAFGAVGGTPRFISSGKGSRVFDAEGREYFDLLSSWGPLILGHAHPEVVEAVAEAAPRGTSFGAPIEAEVDLAEILVEAFPSVEMVRLVNSGTEATMSALRLARAATGRSQILKFAGCYHGHVDSLLVSAGSGAVTFGLPDSPGVTEGTRADTLVAAYNSDVSGAFEAHGDGIAAAIVEPVAANMGVIRGEVEFLEQLAHMCREAGALLIFDEVVTGFRIGPSGAQGSMGVTPDLTVMGKIIGGGLPLGAYGGRRNLMEQVAPVGDVYQAGTLSGNPLSVAAGLATLRVLRATPDAYERLASLGARLAEGLRQALEGSGVKGSVASAGSMLTPFFRETLPHNLAEAREADAAAYGRFFHEMLERGVYLPPSQFEAAFVSLAHTEDEIDRILEAAAEALTQMT